MIKFTSKLRHSTRLSSVRNILAPIFRTYKKRLFLGLAAMLLVDSLQLFIPRIIKSAVDGLSTESITPTSLWHHGLAILAMAVGVGIFRFIWRYLIIGFSRLLERDIRNRLFSHLLTLDKAFFQKKTIGELMALSTNDMAAIQLACGMGLVAFADAFIMLLAGLAFMLYIHPLLTVTALLPMPLLAILTKLLAKKLHIRFRTVQEKFATMTEFARTAITSIRLLKINNLEQSQCTYFNKLGRQYVTDNIQVAKIQGTLFPSSAFIANASLLLVILFGGSLTIDAEITIGDFVAFINYLFMMTWPMMAIGWVANLFQRGLTSLERIDTLLNERPQVTSTSNCSPIIISPNISIQNLNFTYPSASNATLKEISLEIKPGLLGIVGKTGSGKSTLADLLVRLYQVPDNSLFFGNIDVNQVAIPTIREMISFVPQNNQLFSESIEFNISLARPQASREEIEHCAKMAMIDAEIRQFSSGYQTRIGEKGVKLSGGQRQRIILAQALLADRPIIIIDDGLSAVDVDTERSIINNLTDIFSEKTIIYISHRLTPLAAAKQIAIMDEGRIVATGTHEELLQKNTFFKTIYEYQR